MKSAIILTLRFGLTMKGITLRVFTVAIPLVLMRVNVSGMTTKRDLMDLMTTLTVTAGKSINSLINLGMRFMETIEKLGTSTGMGSNILKILMVAQVRNTQPLV